MNPVLTTQFALLVTANVCFFMGHSIFLLLPKFMVTDLKVGEAAIGQAMAIFGLMALLTLPIVGSLADHYGRRLFMLAGALVMGITAFMFMYVSQYNTLVLLLRAFQGLAFPCWFVCSSTMVVDSVEPHLRGSALGIFGISTLVTHGIAPSLAEWLAIQRGFDSVFLLSMSFCFIAVFFTLLLQDNHFGLTAKTKPRPIWQLLRLNSIIYLVLTATLSGIGFGAVLTYSQPHALAKGLNTVSYFIIAYATSSILVRLFFSRLTDHPRPRLIVLPSLLIMASGILLLTWLNSYTLFIISGVLVGLGHALNYPTMNALLINRVRSSERGKGMSLFVGGFNMGATLGQVLFGYLASFFSLGVVFPCAGLLVAMGALTFYLATLDSHSGMIEDH